MGKMFIPVIDYATDRSSVNIFVDSAITDPDFTLLFNAVNTIILDGQQQSQLIVDDPKDGTNSGAATNSFAVRETKWLFHYRDTDGDPHTLEVPCADLQYLQTSGELSLTTEPGLTLKTQFDSLARSKKGLNVTLEKVEHVGRNI